MSFSIKIAGTFDTQQDDGSDIDWQDVNINEEGVFPQRGSFVIGDDKWYLEFFPLPGRFTDKLHMYVMKLIDDVLTPVIDTDFPQGLQLKIDEQIRIYGQQIVPERGDVYLTTTSTGKYKVLISQVV